MFERKNGKSPWARTVQLTSSFNRGEAADLMLVATKWGISPATVIWAVIAEWLSMCRNRNIMKLPYEHSTREILRKARALEQTYEVECEESEGGGRPFSGDVCPLCGHDVEHAEAGGDGRSRSEDREPRETGSEPGSIGSGPVPGLGAGSEAASEV